MLSYPTNKISLPSLSQHVYVASVCLSNQTQLLQALVEADRHNGPSFIVCYAPCIQQQVRPEGLNDMFDGTFILQVIGMLLFELHLTISNFEQNVASQLIVAIGLCIDTTRI